MKAPLHTVKHAFFTGLCISPANYCCIVKKTTKKQKKTDRNRAKTRTPHFPRCRTFISNWIIEYCNSRVFIGLAIMVYQQFYHALRTNVVSVRVILVWFSREEFVLIIISLALVGYEMIITNSMLLASFKAIYHLLSNSRILPIKPPSKKTVIMDQHSSFLSCKSPFHIF